VRAWCWQWLLHSNIWEPLRLVAHVSSHSSMFLWQLHAPTMWLAPLLFLRTSYNPHCPWYNNTRWFKYDRDKLWLVYTQIVPVIFEPPCTSTLPLTFFLRGMTLADRTDWLSQNISNQVPTYTAKARIRCSGCVALIKEKINYLGNLWHLADLFVGGMMMLKWIFHRYVLKMWTKLK
jgi:hypothetical protein